MQRPMDGDAMNTSLPHQEWRELLPFLANDTLHGAERASLEEHLATCLICRSELPAEQRLLRAFRSADAEAAQADDNFVRILARARATTVSASAPAHQSASRRRWWGQRFGQRLTRRVALVATLAAAVLGLAHFQAGERVSVQRFQSLSQDRGHVVGVDLVYVAFAPGVPIDSVEASLRAVGADVVSGPTQDHVFTVRVPATAVGSAVATLAARDGVRFVAPAAPPSARQEMP